MEAKQKLLFSVQNTILELLEGLDRLETNKIIYTKVLTSVKQVQGVQEKLCFFTIHCNPSLAYIAVRDLQRSQRNASVQSLLLAGNFLYNQ